MNTVYTLYRVSTKQQVDKTKDDIPMQREACHEFAERMNWTIGKEFLEKGVSGFKVSASDRDAIQDLKAAALNKEFDLLLVFMFDRIGRIDDETPFIVEWFVKQGIRVWSVLEGEQRFESHVDKLMNYIRFWQASGESEKTSMRIRTRMQQLKAEGSYTGGPVPFGYQLVNTGRLNKKGREVHDLAVDPVEADWVREIFSKTVNEGYGTFRCAEILNKAGVKTHKGSKFTSNSINRILRNRLLTGFVVSGDTESPRIKALQIIDDYTFDRVQHILEQRMVKNEKTREIARTTKTKQLLSGLMVCGHCGGHLSTIKHTDRHTRKDGTEYVKIQPKYICYHKSRGLCRCSGSTTYLIIRIDDSVCDLIHEVFANIKESPDEAVLKKNFDKEMSSYRAKITKLEHELGKHRQQLEKLKSEVAESLMGNSQFSPDVLSKVIKSTEAKISETETAIETLNIEMTGKKKSMESLKPMYEVFVGWAREFDDSTIEKKKMIISALVSKIEVFKGYKLNVELNMDYQEFCENWDVLNKKSTINA